jgi:flagellar biosynthesis protein FlhG
MLSRDHSAKALFMHENKFLKTIAVASGKIGMGKTTVAANLAIAMSMQGRKVMFMDSDFGLINVDVLLRVPPKNNIHHPLNTKPVFKDVLGNSLKRINFPSSGNGLREHTSLTEFQRLNILEVIEGCTSDVDVLLIDTASGILENIAFFCSASQEIIVVTSPDRTSIVDAAALINVLYSKYQEQQFHVLVNFAKNAEEALAVFKHLSLATESCHSVSLDYLGSLPLDEAVQVAVQAQRTFVDLYPYSPASRGIIEISNNLLKSRDKVKGTLQFCIGKLIAASSPQ